MANKEKVEREHIGARVSKKAILNCGSLEDKTGLSFSRIIEKAMEFITLEQLLESMKADSEKSKL